MVTKGLKGIIANSYLGVLIELNLKINDYIQNTVYSFKYKTKCITCLFIYLSQHDIAPFTSR